MKITKFKLREIIKEEIALETLRDTISKMVREMDFKDKESFEKYKSQHKMRPGTKVNVAGKETAVGKATSDEDKGGTDIDKIISTVWGEEGWEGTEDDTFQAVDLLRDKGVDDEDIRDWLDDEFDASEADLEYWMTGDENVYDEDSGFEQ